MENLGLNLGFLLVQIANFAIIFIVLRAWVYQPLMKMLEKRRQVAAQGLEDARLAAEARANAEVDADKIIKEAQVKAGDIVREATERAEAAGRDVRAAAEAEVSKSREAAHPYGTVYCAFFYRACRGDDFDAVALPEERRNHK